jgi:hypothetical protein
LVDPYRRYAVNQKSAFDLISVCGAVVLFLCWVFHQTVVDRMDKQLSSLSAAENLYRVYQSHNAVFNSIIETHKDDKKIEEAIRRFQIYNYGLGLKSLAEQVGLTPLIGYDVTMDDMQAYLEKAQGLAKDLRASVEARRDRDSTVFNFGYGFGSLLAVLGAALKLRLP